jgi:hypothetical protein
LCHAVGAKDRDNTPHADAGECADDEESEDYADRELHRYYSYGKYGPHACHAPAGIALMTGEAYWPT